RDLPKLLLLTFLLTRRLPDRVALFEQRKLVVDDRHQPPPLFRYRSAPIGRRSAPTTTAVAQAEPSRHPPARSTPTPAASAAASSAECSTRKICREQASAPAGSCRQRHGSSTTSRPDQPSPHPPTW